MSSYTLKNTIINDALCFLSTSRHSVPKEDVISMAIAFYRPEDVKSAKELICKISGEAFKQRIKCPNHPNPTYADIDDILNVFEKNGKN